MPNLELPSITTLWPVAKYTTWLHTCMRVNEPIVNDVMIIKGKGCRTSTATTYLPFADHSAYTCMSVSQQHTASVMPDLQTTTARLLAGSTKLKIPPYPRQNKKVSALSLVCPSPLSDLTISSPNRYDCIVLIIVLYYCVLLFYYCILFSPLFSLMATIFQ